MTLRSTTGAEGLEGADDDVRVVLMTAPDRETALELAEALVGRRLAACANVVPGVASVYWWDGALERAEEVLVVLKTRADRVDELVEQAARLHPYDVPELLALPVVGGHGPYAAWVADESARHRDASETGPDGSD